MNRLNLTLAVVAALLATPVQAQPLTGGVGDVIADTIAWEAAGGDCAAVAPIIDQYFALGGQWGVYAAPVLAARRDGRRVVLGIEQMDPAAAHEAGWRLTEAAGLTVLALERHGCLAASYRVLALVPPAAADVGRASPGHEAMARARREAADRRFQRYRERSGG